MSLHVYSRKQGVCSPYKSCFIIVLFLLAIQLPFVKTFLAETTQIRLYNILESSKNGGSSPAGAAPVAISNRRDILVLHSLEAEMTELTVSDITDGSEEMDGSGDTDGCPRLQEKQEDDRVSQRHLRFSGVGRLYVRDENHVESRSPDRETTETAAAHLAVIERLTESTVAVVGLGGVGSWAAEALCRSGVGNIILIDLDDICISNTNRQLHAMSTTVGRLKIETMRDRLLDINPHCNVTTIHDFITSDSAASIIDSLLPDLTVCLDAIDGQNEKTALVVACAERGVPIVTCGGAAGRLDPTKILCDDLTRASKDRLLFWVRKNLRQQYGFEKGPAVLKDRSYKPKKWGISAVFSSEVQKKILLEQVGVSSLRRCDGTLGTACFVTGTYGFVAASRVVEMIANDDLVVPSLKRIKYN